MHPITPGNSSSEHQRTILVVRVGMVALGVGAAVAIVGASLERRLLAIVGLALAGLGVLLIGTAQATYSRSRAVVKAASAAPPTRIYGGRV